MAEKVLGRLGSAAGGLAALAAIPSFCLFNVDGGERAVMFNRFSGVSEKVQSEGTHFKIPGVTWPHIYDIRVRPKLITTTTGTRDLQTVNIHCRLLYKPIVDELAQIHKELGQDFDERVLPSIGNEILKATIAQYNAEQLLTQREKVSQEIRQQITERCGKQFHIKIEDVSIVHLAYGKEFAKAIEEKQVMEQEAERQKFLVELAEQERQATVIRSEGEAEAAQMISKALKDHGNGLIEFRKIEAAKEIADTLGKNSNIVYLPSNQNMLMQMPVAR